MLTQKPILWGKHPQDLTFQVNGQTLNGDRTLMHQDRILFGSNHMYVYYDPVNKESAEGTPPQIDWEFAQKEIAQAKGFQTGADGQLSKGILVWILKTLMNPNQLGIFH